MEYKKLGLEVYINGVPDLKLIPKEIAEALISSLEESVFALRREEIR